MTGNQSKQRLAPGRAGRRAAAMDQKQEAAWAETLQWRTNEQELHQIIRAVIARLDSAFRKEYGVRLDQIADTAELWASASQSAEWYTQAHERYRLVGIYAHLHSGLDQLLRKRARRLVDQRRTRGGEA